MNAYAGVSGSCLVAVILLPLAVTTLNILVRAGRDWKHSIFQANERMCFGVYANLHEDIKRWALQLDRVRVYVQCSFPPVHRNRYPLRVCELVGDVRV